MNKLLVLPPFFGFGKSHIYVKYDFTSSQELYNLSKSIEVKLKDANLSCNPGLFLFAENNMINIGSYSKKDLSKVIEVLDNI